MSTSKLKKSIVLILAIITIFSSLTLFVSAKTLSECFTSGSNRHTEYNASADENDYYKTSWGKTEGYGSSHYIRAYITKDFYGDSGRVWSTYPHNNHYVESDKVWVGSGLAGSLALITKVAYAKYGNTVN